MPPSSAVHPRCQEQFLWNAPFDDGIVVVCRGSIFSDVGTTRFALGHTDDVDARLHWHRAGHGANHTALRLPVDLAYTDELSSMDEAIRREHQLKRWSGQKKAAVIDGDFATLKRLAKRRKRSGSKPDAGG